MLADGRKMPVDVSNGTILTGRVPEEIKNAIETAGDLLLIQKIIPIVGTEFGIKTDPMPKSINITHKDYNCSVPTMKGSKLFCYYFNTLPVLVLSLMITPVITCTSRVSLQYIQNFEHFYCDWTSFLAWVKSSRSIEPACSYADNTMYTCCLEKNRNITLTSDEEAFLPPEIGNITILYDVAQTYEQNYMAQVSRWPFLSP